MLGAAAAILLCFLPSQVNGLLRAEAKCRPEFQWMYSSTGQSPCDVAVELASVCNGRTYQLSPLIHGYVYYGPSLASQNGCFCSSVYYSMLSACAFCQGEAYFSWSTHRYNCTTRVYLGVYPEEIPVGVKVPAYAYQDVLYPDTFNVTFAYNNTGIESSRGLSSSTRTTFASSSAANGGSKATNTSQANSPALIGGVVVGGLVGLGLIVALITFLVLRSKKRSQSQNYNSGFQQSPNMVFTPDATSSLIQPTISPPSGSPGIVYNPNDQSTYPSDMYGPHRQHSPSKNAPNFTGNDTHIYVPQATSQIPAGLSHYTGRQF